MIDRDALFIELALKGRLLSPGQIEDCHRLRDLLSQNAFRLSLPEIVTRKEFLSPDQVRMINIAIRYEETRQEDRDLGAFIVRKGFLTQDKVDECLAQQEAPFREGRHFLRLHDLLAQKGYMTLQQIHVIQRAREQIDTKPAPEKKVAGPGSSARIPVIQPALPPPEAAVPPPPPRPAAAPLPKLTAPETKVLMAGLSLPTLKVTPRRMKVKDLKGAEIVLMILDVQGTLDAHSFRAFDDFLTAILAGRIAHIIIACEKLDYVSSAGIGVLTGAVKKCRDLKGDLRLCSVTLPVRKVIDMIGLASLLRIFDHERGAVMSFKYT